MEGNQVTPTPRRTQIRRVTCWLGALPWKDADTDTLIALVDELLEMSRPYGVDSVWTSEPRTYRITPRGISSLRDALRHQRAESLHLGSPIESYWAAVDIFDNAFPSIANASVEIVIVPDDVSAVPSVIAQLVDFLTRWFAPFNALSAFVSFEGIEGGVVIGDVPMMTAMERERHVTPLEAIPILEAYARGVFWGNGLGPNLCARLGGVERILAEAPVPVARRLGEGVWLQLSGTPPPDPTELARLASYLRPLVDWTWEGTQALVQAFLATNRQAETIPKVSPMPLPSVSTKEKSGKKTRVPVRWLPDAGEDTGVGLNVYLATPPSTASRAQLEALVAAWYEQGFEGGFGGAGFHVIWGPSEDGTVLRWYVDMGSADQRQAIQGLSEQLAIPELSVVQLVIGEETVDETGLC